MPLNRNKIGSPKLTKKSTLRKNIKLFMAAPPAPSQANSRIRSVSVTVHNEGSKAYVIEAVSLADLLT